MIENFGAAMQMLQLEKSKFYRVKKGQTAKQIENALSIPANCCFDGAIIALENCAEHVVQPFENYSTIATKTGVQEDVLKNFNGNRPLYPSCKIFIPVI